MRKLLLFFSVILTLAVNAQFSYDTSISPADTRLGEYLHLLKHKKVGLIVNQTSRVDDKLLLDVLTKYHIKVTKIFVPEHGFRGAESAGANIEGGIDSATSIPVVSLYGKKQKPSDSDLVDVDIMVYDLQDVGVRFYTYISTMQYCMEACAALHKEFMVLDRPNPNGFYIAGPVLDKEFTSFVGKQCIPIVYGMTVGEYARMLVGEKWFDNSTELKLIVIPCKSYSHDKKYKLPIPPSPNLRTMTSVYAYPTLCLLEGTPISVGRGTDNPFGQWGCPDYKGSYAHSFVPRSSQGAKNPLFEGDTCYGVNVGRSEDEVLKTIGNNIHLDWIIDAYKHYPHPDKFFSKFFRKLAGNTMLEEQIKSGMSAKEIKKSWQSDLEKFKAIRSNYLLYP